MDLTVEIHGDGSLLEECLDQFPVHGGNMYKCDCFSSTCLKRHLI